ncbi:LAETG motif-containing sortase-dependent surface protein [Streptomyces sp. NPDC048275]|uniref:LAETG motif-containing sortase-dependent surface protein n=1 Tax=Streptomyces sp. NPDC048275 TaxID=3155629 RepID=UPI00340C5739
MSKARRVTLRCLLGAGAATLALSAATSSAWATGTPGGDGWDNNGGGYKPGQGAGTVTAADRCEFSLDGTNFYDWVRVDDQNLKPTDDGKVHIKVRAASDAGSCTASLAAYRTHGATFKTSGEQVFHDFDTVKVKPGETDSLDIAVPDVGCYAQIDLYRGAVKFDGKFDANDGFEHGDLPKGPDRAVIKDKLIMAWNGGKKDCTAQPPSTPETTPPASTPPASTPPASTPPAETPGTPTPTTPTESTPSETPSGPSASESTTPPAPTPNGGQSTPPGDLAETGGGNALPIAGGAAALLVAGGAITVATRRRRSTRTSS